jgi:hypothetical protein
VPLEVREVEAGATVADMAVGPDQVLGAASSAETGQGRPARVPQVPGERLGPEPVHHDQAAVLLPEPGQPLGVLAVRGAAQQQMEPWRGQRCMQAAGDLVPDKPRRLPREVRGEVSRPAASSRPVATADRAKAMATVMGMGIGLLLGRPQA